MDIRPVSSSALKIQEEPKPKEKVKVEAAAVEQPKVEEAPVEEKETGSKINLSV